MTDKMPEEIEVHGDWHGFPMCPTTRYVRGDLYDDKNEELTHEKARRSLLLAKYNTAMKVVEAARHVYQDKGLCFASDPASRELGIALDGLQTKS